MPTTYPAKSDGEASLRRSGSISISVRLGSPPFPAAERSASYRPCFSLVDSSPPDDSSPRSYCQGRAEGWRGEALPSDGDVGGLRRSRGGSRRRGEALPGSA
ncbi:hypothetical protein PVAP13_8NG135401 [Panicum virgatum]|uniref:Uncharacterized protein n=1 Tax=Panicum virgatum TaxID=38727 RepID=A0A8T0P8X2_PANVG|nr:hypothetical protein PVAP13_8NG135401 [Panicum virgatum]